MATSDDIEREMARLRLRAEAAEKREAEERRGREEAEKREEIERRGREEEQKKNQKTTLDEFVMACHNLFHLKMEPETRAGYQTKGGTTNPANKYYPRRFALWEDFPKVQQETYAQMWELINVDKNEPPRVFSPLLALEDLSSRVTRPIGSEQDLEHYERTYVEDMVTRIMEYLQSTKVARDCFDLGSGVYFTNNANSMGDTDENALKELQKVEAKRQIITPEHSPVRARVSKEDDEDEKDDVPVRARADQYFIWKKVDGTQKLILLVEYKPPHKISVEHLVYGFRDRSIDQFLANPHIPSNDAPPEEKAEYKADKLCTDVATQIFHYMIVNGLEYSYITTGKGLVFLRIMKDEPDTLYYHLSVPTEDVKQDEALEYLYPRTSVAQILSLCLMAFKTERRTVRWRKQVKKALDTYAVNWYAILEGQGALDSDPPKAGSNYKGRQNPIKKNSPYYTRAWTRCNPGKKEENLHDNDSDEGSGPETPTRKGKSNIQHKQVAAASKVGGVRRGTGNDHGRGRGNGRQRYRQPYCTQDCLAGLVRGTDVDWNCPNVDLHHKCIYDEKHAIDREQFAELVRKQLEDSLDVNCEPLGIQGSRGALFRIVLASHGYVFVSKGTVKRYRRHILHEGEIYRYLEPLQGTAIPVYLGNIDLVDSYPYDFQVEIIHMLLMSWAGEEVFGTIDWKEAKTTLDEVAAAGVRQGDEAERNLLWNEEKQRYMQIDFERATYIKPVNIEPPKLTIIEEENTTSHILQEISPNKKRVSVAFSKTKKMKTELDVSFTSKANGTTASTMTVTDVEDKENVLVGYKGIEYNSQTPDGFVIFEDKREMERHSGWIPKAAVNLMTL